jgi:hypothetical protein
MSRIPNYNKVILEFGALVIVTWRLFVIYYLVFGIYFNKKQNESRKAFTIFVNTFSIQRMLWRGESE